MCLMHKADTFPCKVSYSRDNSAFHLTAHFYNLCALMLTFHLQVLPHDELMETKKSHRQSHRKKVLPEIYLTRLLSTKVTRSEGLHIT